MAIYEIIGQRADTENLGGTKTQAVQVIEVVTKEHSIYFEARAPRSLATTANLRGLAESYALTYEALADMPGVEGVQWTQDARPDGTLEDHVILYVLSYTGQSEGTLDFPLDKVTTDYVDPRVKLLRQALTNTEGEG